MNYMVKERPQTA